jgi:hypothetical protein
MMYMQLAESTDNQLLPDEEQFHTEGVREVEAENTLQ